MTYTTIALTFANRRYEPEIVELVHAWDIDSLQENPTGYEDTKHKAIESLGNDLLRWVTVEVEVPDDTIREVLLGELPTLHASDPAITGEGN